MVFFADLLWQSVPEDMTLGMNLYLHLSYSLGSKVSSVTVYFRSLSREGLLYSKSYVFSQNYGAVQIEATLSYNISVGKIETLRPLRISA